MYTPILYTVLTNSSNLSICAAPLPGLALSGLCLEELENVQAKLLALGTALGQCTGSEEFRETVKERLGWQSPRSSLYALYATVDVIQYVVSIYTVCHIYYISYIISIFESLGEREKDDNTHRSYHMLAAYELWPGDVRRSPQEGGCHQARCAHIPSGDPERRALGFIRLYKHFITIYGFISILNAF